MRERLTIQVFRISDLFLLLQLSKFMRSVPVQFMCWGLVFGLLARRLLVWLGLDLTFWRGIVRCGLLFSVFVIVILVIVIVTAEQGCWRC